MRPCIEANSAQVVNAARCSLLRIAPTDFIRAGRSAAIAALTSTQVRNAAPCAACHICHAECSALPRAKFTASHLRKLAATAACRISWTACCRREVVASAAAALSTHSSNVGSTALCRIRVANRTTTARDVLTASHFLNAEPTA
eukprot:1455825-Prymnesium_polylepis.2